MSLVAFQSVGAPARDFTSVARIGLNTIRLLAAGNPGEEPRSALDSGVPWALVFHTTGNASGKAATSSKAEDR